MSVFVDGHVHVDSRDTMLAVLKELVGDDAARFRGTVMSWPEQNPPGAARWAIELCDWKGNLTRAELGDHLILTFGYLLKVTDAEYLEQQGGGS